VSSETEMLRSFKALTKHFSEIEHAGKCSRIKVVAANHSVRRILKKKKLLKLVFILHATAVWTGFAAIGYCSWTVPLFELYWYFWCWNSL